jgi:Ser/Thr protein kinase RdoA (MazF antagonist)
MDHFPVSSSHLSAVHLAPFMQKKYGFSTQTRCRFIKAGVNDTYLVEDGGDRFVFRVYSLNWRTRAEIAEEIRLIRLLESHGIAVSYPIPDGSGNYIQALNAPEGDRPGVLFSYASGEKQHRYPPEIHFKIGKLMAELHRVTQNLQLERVTYNSQTLLADAFEQIKPFLPEGAPERGFMESTLTRLLDLLQQERTNELRKGAVHLDIWFDNLNITAEGGITLFDFDCCGNGWLCLDLAYYILQLHSIEKDKQAHQQKLDSFWKGYESISPLPEAEKQLIPALGVCLYVFYLGLQCRRFENWSNSFLNESYVKRYISMLIKPYFELHYD